MLLVTAGLLALSFARLRGTEPGFAPARVLLLKTDLPRPRYDTPEKQIALWARLAEQLARLPDVERVAAIDHPPFAGSPTLAPYADAARPLPPVHERVTAARGIVSPGAFATLGMRLLAGRDFSAQDRLDTPAVAVVNESAARRLFGREAPLGKRLVLGVTGRTAEVIGLVADVRAQDLATEPIATVYFSTLQRPRTPMHFALRTAGDPAALASAARAVLAETDPDLPVIRAVPLAELVAQSVADARVTAGLLGAFAATALGLAVLGVYGTVRYAVAHRAGEMGLRLALGATPARVRRLVVGETAGPVALGLLAGAVASALVAGFLQRLLFEVSAFNAPVLAGLGALLGAAALAAAWLPACRAAGVDPATVLRAE